MDFIFKVDPIRRNIKVPDGFTVLTMDHNVHKLVFVCPYYEDFAFDSASIVFMVDAPDGKQYIIPAEEYESFPNSPSPYVKFTLTLKSYITSVVGYISFCITADIISSGNVIEKSWHSKNITISVGGHIDNDDSEDIPEEDVPTINQRLNNLDSKVGRLQTTVNGMANGSPTPVSTVAEMTDESAVYLYTGSETGYTAGDWYYYNGSVWTSGGTYGGAVTDTTLSIEGAAADAKTVGDALADKADADDLTALETTVSGKADSSDVTALDTRVTAVEDDVSNLKGDLNDSLRERTNQLFNKNDADVFAGFDMTGTVQASVGGRSVIIPVDITNQTYLTVHRTVLSARFGVATFTAYPAVGSSSVNYIVDNNAYSITIPVSSSIKYVMILVHNSSIDTTYTFDQIVDELMVQYGDTFTGYETYYIAKILDRQITPEKLTNALQVQVEQGETNKILFGDSTNLWNTPLLEIMNNTRISGYNTSTYEITTVSAEGYVTAIMDIPENINFLRIKKSSTLPSAGQAYVLIDSTKRINNNRPFSAFSDSFKDIIVRYDSGDDYYTVNLAHARNYGFTKLGICVCNTDNMYVLTDKITSNWLICNPDIYCPVGAFGSIGAIGDSYTAGSIVKADNSWVDMPNQSYIAVMGKRAGVQWSNYGMGGTNTRTYITNKLPAVLSADANDLYFLALGINDSSLGLSYIGSISDIHDDDYTQNADTFYGNYGKIIAQVKAHAPNARFCMVKIPIYVALRKELNVAIEAIANHYGFACIDPMDDPYFYSNTFYSRVSNHPSCIGYAGMALAYERLLSKAIEKNPLYFFYANIDANIPTVVS